MRRNAIALSAFVVTAVLATSTLGQAGEGDQLKELRREVRTLEVLKDLKLTPAQLKQLHTLSSQASELRLANEQDLETLKATAGEMLGKRREQILRNEEMSTADEQQIESLRSEYKEKHKELGKALETLAGEAKKVLSEEQVLQLKEKLGRGKRASREGGEPGVSEGRIGKREGRERGERGEPGDRGGRHGRRSKHGLGRWLADPSTGKALESLMGQTAR